MFGTPPSSLSLCLLVKDIQIIQFKKLEQILPQMYYSSPVPQYTHREANTERGGKEILGKSHEVFSSCPF